MHLLGESYNERYGPNGEREPRSDFIDGGALEGVRFEPSLDTKAAYADFVEATPVPMSYDELLERHNQALARSRLLPGVVVVPDPCPRGFVPKHGFGLQRVCAVCDRPYEDHPVVVQ